MLVVEDDEQIRNVLRRYFERERFAVLTASTGAEALSLLGNEGVGDVDAIVLDLGLPDIDGSDILRLYARIPTLVLTARATTEERILGLQHGAADYVAKPFSPTEVVLRVRAILRRGNHEQSNGVPTYGDGRLVIDEAAHTVSLDGELINLTPTEWGILTTLASVPGRVYSRYELVNRVRGYEFSGYERTIDTHVKNLRQKLHDDSRLIETVVGVGYRLSVVRDD